MSNESVGTDQWLHSKVAGADGKGCGRKRQKDIFMGETTHTDCSDFTERAINQNSKLPL